MGPDLSELEDELLTFLPISETESGDGDWAASTDVLRTRRDKAFLNRLVEKAGFESKGSAE